MLFTKVWFLLCLCNLFQLKLELEFELYLAVCDDDMQKKNGGTRNGGRAESARKECRPETMGVLVCKAALELYKWSIFFASSLHRQYPCKALLSPSTSFPYLVKREKVSHLGCRAERKIFCLCQRVLFL